MKRFGACLVFLLCIQLFPVFVMETSAIPVFARKYRTSCTTCHIMITKRNAFGEAFRKNGYRIGDDDDFFTKEKPVSLGAEAWKRKFPDAVWPSKIPGAVPVAFVADLSVDWLEGLQQPEFFTPKRFWAVWAGTLGNTVSFWSEFKIYERSDELPLSSKRPHFTEFALQWNDMLGFWGIEDVFNIKLGRFEVGAIQSFKSNNRLTIERYNTVFATTDSNFRFQIPQDGIEINGILFDRFEYSTGVVNGIGMSPVSDYALKGKDYYYRIAYKFGGMPFTGPEMGDTLSSGENWRDDSIQISQFGFFGDHSFRFNRIGFDVRALYNRFEISTQFWKGKDFDPNATGLDLTNTVWFAEGQVRIFPWMYVVARYEYEDRIEESTGREIAKDKRLILSLAMIQFANLKWNVEHLRPIDDNAKGKEYRIQVKVAF